MRFQRKQSPEAILLWKYKRQVFLAIVAIWGIQKYLSRRIGVPIPPQMLQLWSGESLRENLVDVHLDDGYFFQDVDSLISKSQLKTRDIQLEYSKSIVIAVAYCRADLNWLKKSIAYEIPSESNIIITLLSKCGNEYLIPSFKSISNVKKVEVMKLPNKGGCDIAISHFINHYMNTNSAETSANTILIFLKDTPRTPDTCHQLGRYRTLQEMLYVSSNGHFVCGVKPACDMSVYHDTRFLKDFKKVNYRRHGDNSWSTNDFNAAGYKNMEHFIGSEFNWSFPNEVVTEVCYGGSFAVPAKLLFANPKLQAITTKLEKILSDGPTMSVVEHFAERLWASLLAEPLSPHHTELLIPLRKFVHTKNGRYMGTLGNDTITEC